jgi:type I restriction enzyme S subunit
MTRKMKDSGIERIGEIPEDWEIVPLKNVSVEFYSGGTPTSSVDSFYTDKETGYPFINISDLTNKKEVENIEKHITKLAVQSKNLKLINNDYVLLAMYASTGTVSLLSLNSYISQAILAIKPNKMLDKEFLYYFLYSFKPYSVAYSRGTTQNNLNADIVKNIKISLPDIKKQQSIVNILNRKILKLKNVKDIIDNEIEILEEYKKSLITEAVTKGLNPDVEMKDSGIEWIGEIPKHWLINKIGRVCSTVTDYVASGSFASLAKNVTYLDNEDYAMLIRTVDLSNKRGTVERVYVDKKSYDFLRNSNLFGGEIILPNIGASVGDVYIVPKLYEKMTLAPNSIMIKTNYIDMYYYYFFLSKVGRELLENISISSAQAKFNKTDLKQLKVTQPPIKEQQEIVSYLDEKCKIIDDAIKKKNQQVEILEDYKKSLIYEYVTGKKEVPHA